MRLGELPPYTTIELFVSTWEQQRDVKTRMHVRRHRAESNRAKVTTSWHRRTGLPKAVYYHICKLQLFCRCEAVSANL